MFAIKRMTGCAIVKIVYIHTCVPELLCMAKVTLCDLLNRLAVYVLHAGNGSHLCGTYTEEILRCVDTEIVTRMKGYSFFNETNALAGK